MIIDSHCHLSYKNDVSKIDEILKRATKVGVNKFLNIATHFNEFETIKSISDIYENIYFTLGIHPHESSQTNNDVTNYIRNNLSNQKLLGIGETGLDYYYNHSDKVCQIKSLEIHIELAQEIEKPLIIHMRDAEKDIIRIFSKKIKQKKFSGVIHCFTGSLKFAQEIIEMGFFISASGIITFKNSGLLRDTFQKIPLTNLLVETDTPYLAPIPNRGKENEPSFIVHTIEKLCEIHSVDFQEMCKITTNNFAKLFNI